MPINQWDLFSLNRKIDKQNRLIKEQNRLLQEEKEKRIAEEHARQQRIQAEKEAARDERIEAVYNSLTPVQKIDHQINLKKDHFKTLSLWVFIPGFIATIVFAFLGLIWNNYWLLGSMVAVFIILILGSILIPIAVGYIVHFLFAIVYTIGYWLYKTVPYLLASILGSGIFFLICKGFYKLLIKNHFLAKFLPAVSTFMNATSFTLGETNIFLGFPVKYYLIMVPLFLGVMIKFFIDSIEIFKFQKPVMDLKQMSKQREELFQKEQEDNNRRINAIRNSTSLEEIRTNGKWTEEDLFQIESSVMKQWIEAHKNDFDETFKNLCLEAKTFKNLVSGLDLSEEEIKQLEAISLNELIDLFIKEDIQKRKIDDMMVGYRFFHASLLN